MTHLFSRRLMAVLFVLLTVMVSLSCVTLLGKPQGENSTSQEVIVELDLVYGPGNLIFPDTRAGLTDLSSYKATLILSFDGTEAGQPSQWTKTYVMLVTKEPAARHLTIEKTGDLSDLDAVVMVEMNGTDYERVGETACTANAVVDGDSLGERMEPVGFLTGVHGAEEAGNETVNDLAVTHYTFDQRALGQQDLSESTGEMWVATEGGYIVKYLLTTKGDAEYFGEGIEGTVTLDYQLSDINQPLTLELPADCTTVFVNAPLLPDASDVVSMPGMLSFNTSTSLAEAVAFYQEQIPGLGWVSLDEPVIGETSALLEYEQGDQILSVIVITEDGLTTVNILLSNSQE